MTKTPSLRPWNIKLQPGRPLVLNVPSGHVVNGHRPDPSGRGPRPWEVKFRIQPASQDHTMVVNPVDHTSAIGRSLGEEEKDRASWLLGDYVPEPCPKCGRQRLCRCENGLHRCEKCNFVPELGRYVSVGE